MTIDKIQTACDWVLAKKEKSGRSCSISVNLGDNWFNWENEQFSPLGACLWYADSCQQPKWLIPNPILWINLVSDHLEVSFEWALSFNCYLQDNETTCFRLFPSKQEIIVEKLYSDYELIFDQYGVSSLEAAQHFRDKYGSKSKLETDQIQTLDPETKRFYQKRVFSDLREWKIYK